MNNAILPEWRLFHFPIAFKAHKIDATQSRFIQKLSTNNMYCKMWKWLVMWYDTFFFMTVNGQPMVYGIFLRNCIKPVFFFRFFYITMHDKYKINTVVRIWSQRHMINDLYRFLFFSIILLIALYYGEIRWYYHDSLLRREGITGL